MMLRCAIVDDEPLALSLLESYVNKTPFLQLVGKYSSAVQAMKELPGEANLLRRFPASCQQGPSMVRTCTETGRDRQYFCEK